MASEPLKSTPRTGAPSTEPARTDSLRPGKIPSLFRPIDWLSFGLTALLVMVGYMYTLAPDLTLEDSGELAVASLYAGVPHPPGYPVWTIYTWVFTKIIPFGNIAWRVGISSAFAGALACGLIALMVSRGSSMFIESVVEFKTIPRRVENWICLVSGFVSGMLIGFNGFMWSQAVIVEVYTLSMLSLVGVLCCLLRWTHGPTQFRYFYFAWFLCGIAFNNHQSLLVISVAMEVLAIVVHPRLGRSLLFWNLVACVGSFILSSKGSLSLLSDNTPVFLIFLGVGVFSLVGWIILSIKTQAKPGDYLQEAILGFTAIIMLAWKGVGAMVGAVLIELLAFLALDIYNRSRNMAAPWSPIWRKSVASFFAFALGVGFYIYMPLASMTNPPLNWGYPRTVGGFIHAFTRGQYERIHPTAGTGNNIVEQTISWITRYAQQTWWILIKGPIEEFNIVYVLLAFIPLFFFRRLQKRERAWLIGLVAFYIVLGPFLLELFNPAPDRQSLSLNKPFFIASHVIIAMMIGYGISMILSELVSAYDRFRRTAIIGFAVASLLAIYGVADTYGSTPYSVLRFTAIVGLLLALAATLILILSPSRAPIRALLAVVMLMPAWAIFGHWSENEQRGHMFGFWFGHDMFTPPFKGKDGKLTYSRAAREELMKTPEGRKNIYPEMTKDAILFGGTDPGRFCPTYMIFCESFVDPEDRHNPEFDRRDVYIITQNALADGTYLQYIRGHYFRSDEYQYDTPFFQDLMRSEKEKQGDFKTNLAARLIAVPLDNLFINKIGDSVEKSRRAGSSMFEPEHFTNISSFAKKLAQGDGPAELSKYLRERLSPETQKLLGGTADKNLARRLAEELNELLNNELEGVQQLKSLRAELTSIDQQMGIVKESARKKLESRKAEILKKIEFYSSIVPFYTPARFQQVKLTPYLEKFVKQDPQYHSRIRLNRLLMEAAFPGEIASSPGGVYPDMEIYTPTPEDSQRCFQEYMADAQQRMSRNQLKPGEDVRVIDNKVQVSGQVAVMAINGLLTKVIFEKNPDNEFFVEESFPLEWMYPYLTPFGIIMKINRQPLPELTQEIVDRDHNFWSDYSERSIGNWITYDTPVSNITAFCERVYVNKDYKGFKGDPKFVRDDDGQKAFSKLRSSIAGVYAWRLQNSQPGTANYERMLKEAEFAFKQAYAFCPYSPEALYRYVNLLAGVRRFDDAVLLAQTSRKLDPGNVQLDRLIEELQRLRTTSGGGSTPLTPALQTLEAQYNTNKANFATAVAYAQEAARVGDVTRVVRVADDILANPAADATAIQFAMQIYAQPQIQDFPKLENALKRWTTLNPGADSWLDLAGAQAMQNKTTEAIASLRQSITLNRQRLAADPKASNIIPTIIADQRFARIKDLPEFQALVRTNN